MREITIHASSLKTWDDQGTIVVVLTGWDELTDEEVTFAGNPSAMSVICDFVVRNQIAYVGVEDHMVMRAVPGHQNLRQAAAEQLAAEFGNDVSEWLL